MQNVNLMIARRRIRENNARSIGGTDEALHEALQNYYLEASYSTRHDQPKKFLLGIAPYVLPTTHG